MYFELDNDDMESSKRHSLFISFIFILKCLPKPFIIRNNYLFFLINLLTIKHVAKSLCEAQHHHP